MKFKSVARIISDDATEFDMFMQAPDGGWFKTMAIQSERIGKSKKKRGY